MLTTKFDAAQRKVKDEPVIQKEKEGHKFLLSLKINDMLKLTGVDKTGKDISGYYRVQKLSKGIIVDIHTRMRSGNQRRNRFKN